jgi:OmpA-OmpF porin, OOP family
MVRKLTFFGLFFTLLAATASAQEPVNASASAKSTFRSFSPADQWEAGLHLGVPFIDGDNTDGGVKLGFGGGLHVRKSLDHIFSIRGNLTYAKTGSEFDNRTTTDLGWLSGSGQVVMTLNNFRFNKPYRKILLNVFAGAGATRLNSSVKEGTIANFDPADEVDGEITTHIEFGAGVSFRLTPKVNISLEHTVYSPFGKYADLLDVNPNRTLNVTSYRDNLQYPHVSLNLNLGGKTKDGVAKSEPLYWVNPLMGVSEAIAALEARPVYDPTDDDGDGIINSFDAEPNTVKGAPVTVRGTTLDSDGDKVPDYMDKEPHSPYNYISTVNKDGIANVPKPLTEGDVNRIVQAEIAKIKLPELPAGCCDAGWFLPMINFGDNRRDIEKSEYEKLYQVASVMKAHPEFKIVATGHTDGRSGDTYNNVLSYNRALSAINFLVSQHGISRDRLILNWGGKATKMIPTEGNNRQNRRVEFRVSGKDDKEMGRPEGPDAGIGRFQGNTSSGY